MQIRPINPQTWLGAFNVNQAIEVTSGQRVLYVSGQTSNDANGAPMHPGDLVAQFKLAWKNLVEVLTAANMKPANIVRLNFYTTDVDGFMAKAGEMVPLFAEAGCKPVSTLLGVSRLFEPSIMIRNRGNRSSLTAEGSSSQSPGVDVKSVTSSMKSAPS